MQGELRRARIAPPKPSSTNDVSSLIPRRRRHVSTPKSPVKIVTTIGVGADIHLDTRDLSRSFWTWTTCLGSSIKDLPRRVPALTSHCTFYQLCRVQHGTNCPYVVITCDAPLSMSSMYHLEYCLPLVVCSMLLPQRC